MTATKEVIMTGEKKASAVRYHRRALLEAADRLLTELGYDGMNMNMLAKEANYSKATVYVYFESKDEIVRALCIERLKLMRRELALVLKSDADTDGKLAEVRQMLDELASGDGVYFDFACEFGGRTDTDSARELNALIRGIFDDLTALAPEQELKNKWYRYYGEVKTKGLFAEGGGA